jgi:hypothetical protein
VTKPTEFGELTGLSGTAGDHQVSMKGDRAPRPGSSAREIVPAMILRVSAGSIT